MLYRTALMLSILFLTESRAQWVQIPGTGGKDVFSLAADGPNFFAGGLDSIYRSTNYGMEWQSLQPDLPSGSVIISLANTGQHVVAGTDFWGIFASSDNGDSWDSTTLEYYTVYSLWENNSIFFASADLFDCFEDCGVFRSTDNGNTWENIFLSADPTSFSVTGSGLLLSDNENLFRSTNNGVSWALINALPPVGYLYTSYLFGDIVLLASEEGLYRAAFSDTTWHNITAGLPVGAQIVSIADGGGSLFSIVDGDKVYCSNDAGLSWQVLNDGLPANLFVQSIIWQNGFLYATTSDGIWFMPANNSTVTIPITLYPSWNMVSIPVAGLSMLKDSIFPSASSAAFVYSGGYTCSGYCLEDSLVVGKGFWLKFPEADTIVTLGTEILSDSFDVQAGWNMIGSISVPVAIASIGGVPSPLVASGFFGYTTGSGYTSVVTVMPGKAYWVKVNQAGKLILSSPGVLASNRITVIPTNELPPPPPGIEPTTQKTEIPNRITLEQNYPNPFNSSTVIRYSLSVNSFVTLKLYNTLGAEVASLVNQTQDAGEYSISWNAVLESNQPGGLPSGVYTYRLTAHPLDVEHQDMYFSEKKLVLLK